MLHGILPFMKLTIIHYFYRFSSSSEGFCDLTGIGYEKGRELFDKFSGEENVNMIKQYSIVSNFSYAVEIILMYYHDQIEILLSLGFYIF